MKSLPFTLAFIFVTNALIAQNNDIDLLGCKLNVLSRSYEKGYRKIEIEYEMFSKRYYDKNGKIKKDVIYSKNHKEVLTNLYNSKGQLKNQKPITEFDYDICFAIKKAIKMNIQQSEIYIKNFEFDSWEYPNSWLIAKDSIISPKLEETYGLIINKKSGKESEYYTRKTFPLKSEEEKQFMMWDYDDKRAQFALGNEKLREYLTPKYNFTSNEIVHGLVAIVFGIDESGNVFNPEIIRGINEYQNNEALRIINSMPKWIPAEKSDGTKIKDYFTLVIYFNKEE